MPPRNYFRQSTVNSQRSTVNSQRSNKNMTVEELVCELCKNPSTAEVEIRLVYSSDVYLIDEIKATLDGVVRIVAARFPVDPNLAGLDLSKREFFAAAALQGLLTQQIMIDDAAVLAVSSADALIVALNSENADTSEASAQGL